MNADEKMIAAVLANYQDALNQSSTDAVMKFYAPDGVFMPQKQSLQRRGGSGPHGL